MAATARTAIAVIGIDIGKNCSTSSTSMIAAQLYCVRSGRASKWKHGLPMSQPA
jgi:hypothetical protein